MGKPTNFFSYWYFRYLLVTELFMVEKWERVMFHIVMFIFLSVLSLFNTTVILGLVSYVTQRLLWNEENTVNMVQDAIQNEL